MAAVQQAMPAQQGAGNAAMARMLPPGMSKEKVQEIYRVRLETCILMDGGTVMDG